MNIKFDRNIFAFWGSIIYRHILIFGVLCLFIGVIDAQIRPRQLRNQILQSQNPAKPTPQKGAKKQRAKSIRASKPGPLAPIVNPLDNKKATLVFLEDAQIMSFDQILHPDIQVLKGAVRFRHDNTLMYCDSAYFYEKANSLDAFGNVRIVQGDTLFVYGD